MNIETLLKHYDQNALVDVMLGGRCISTSNAPNISKIYKGSTVDCFEVVCKTSGDGRLVVCISEAYAYGEKITE